MENHTVRTRDTGAILVGLMLALLLILTGCSDDSGPEFDPKCFLCEPEDFEDHVLKSLPIYYRWKGLFVSWLACANQ